MSLKDTLKRSFGIFGASENKEGSEWQDWYAEQRRKLEAGEEIEPPWMAFPNSSPIYGWNQGNTEHWKMNVWMPFWNRMSEAEREDYFQKHHTSDEWLETITVFWTGDSNKSNG
jgi:hypothetical protein